MRSAALLQAGSGQLPRPDEPFEGAETREAERTGAAKNVLDLLEVAAADYSKLETEAQDAEAMAQKEYEEYMHSHEVQKAANEKELEHLEAEKKRIVVDTEEATETQQVNMLETYLAELKKACTWGETYEERKEK